VEAVGFLKYQAHYYEENYMQNNNSFTPSMAEVLVASPSTGVIKEIWAGSSSSQGTGMYLYAILQDNLGFGTNNRIMLGLVKSSSGNIVIVCGQWQTTLYVPVRYLPSNCNQTGLAGYPGMVN